MFWVIFAIFPSIYKFYLSYNFSCFGEPWLENSGLDSGGLNSSFVKFVDLNIWNSFSVCTTSLYKQNMQIKVQVYPTKTINIEIHTNKGI
jgi:hypothetical protein